MCHPQQLSLKKVGCLMNTLVNAPRMVHLNDEIVCFSVITRNRTTGLITFLSGGDSQQGLDTLNEVPEPTVKIEVAATIAPEQTASVAPAKRGRKPGSKNKTTAHVETPVVETKNETPVETTVAPRKRGRPAGSKNKSNANTTPAASTPESTTPAKGKGFNKPLTKKIFAVANMIGKGIILTKKNKEMEVWIVGEEGDKFRVCNPDKDQSSMKKGFVFGATWKIAQDRLIKML